MKPVYRVPSMEEIQEIPWNGYKAVSTFSGGGGSCLGMKMAGFKVLWASEFIAAAQDTYRANHTDTILDTRDIRLVTADEILESTGLKVGELDVLEGSPPCSAFSTAGKRDKHWGQAKSYSDGATQVVDDLFFEYARLLEGLQPKTFIAENVSGLIKGTAKGYFKNILARLKDCGYVVEARLLDSQWLGVPQARQRLIFMGVRNDLGVLPHFPDPFQYRYSVSDAIPSATGYRTHGGITSAGKPAPTILTHGNPHTFSEFIAYSEDNTNVDPETGHSLVVSRTQPIWHDDGCAYDPETGSRIDFGGTALEPEFEKASAGKEHRFFLLAPSKPSEPAPTVSATAGSSRGTAGVTHYEPRKFTLQELRRLCSFPDDFVLTGTYAQRWERLGRSVPPLMMKQIASSLRDQVLGKITS